MFSIVYLAETVSHSVLKLEVESSILGQNKHFLPRAICFAEINLLVKPSPLGDMKETEICSQ